MSGVVSVDAGLVVRLERGGEVSNVGSDVALLFTNGEEEVLRGILLKLLSADLNALDDNGKTDVCAEVGAGGKCLGDINGSYLLDGLVNDSDLTALDLLHAGVGSHRTGDRNGHADLDTQILDGILRDAVAVITARHAGVSEEEVVVLVADLFGVDGNDDTFNREHVVLLCCHVVSVRVNIVLGNREVESNGLGSSVACLDGCGQLVRNFLGGLFVNADRNSAVCGLTNGNLVRVDRPVDLIGNAGDHDLRNDRVVNCGYREILLVEALHVSNGAVKVVGDLVNGRGRLLACNERRAYHHSYE